MWCKKIYNTSRNRTQAVWSENELVTQHYITHGLYKIVRNRIDNSMWKMFDIDEQYIYTQTDIWVLLRNYYVLNGTLLRFLRSSLRACISALRALSSCSWLSRHLWKFSTTTPTNMLRTKKATRSRNEMKYSRHHSLWFTLGWYNYQHHTSTTIDPSLLLVLNIFSTRYKYSKGLKLNLKVVDPIKSVLN